MKKQFPDIKKLTREEARKAKLLKTTFSTSCNLITQYNPLLPNLKTIIIKHLPILCSNQQMLDTFPHNTLSVTYKRNKNLTQILSPSLFPMTTKQNECYIKECDQKKFFYQSTIITFLQTKTNNNKLKTFIKEQLAKHYITFLPFVIFRQ